MVTLVAKLQDDVAKARRLNLALAERVYAQSELLSRRAERKSLNRGCVMQLAKVSTDNVIALGPNTVTFNSSAFLCDAFKQAWGYLNVTARSGTSPTLDVKIQESVDGVTWVDSGFTFTQMTNVGVQRLSITALGGNYYRAVCTIGGTTPSFTFSLDVIGKN